MNEITPSTEKIRRAIGDRGSCILYIYRQLQREGVKDAKEILCRAISAWGAFKAGDSPAQTPPQWIARIEGGNPSSVYERNLLQSEEPLALMEMHHCPLLAAWKAAGATAQELRDLCDIASEGDYASAGPHLCLSFDQRLADGAAYCLMRVVPKANAD